MLQKATSIHIGKSFITYMAKLKHLIIGNVKIVTIQKKPFSLRIVRLFVAGLYEPRTRPSQHF